MPFVRANDLQVYYLDHGTGTPVVFVHGNWVTSTIWEPVLAQLPAGYRGLAYDMRGRGQTSGPDSDYSLPALADDLRAFADALGLDRFHLVGLSLGSGVAMEFALTHPARLRSLAVISPAWVDGMPVIPDMDLEARQRQLHDDKNFYTMALKMQMPSLPENDFWRRIVDEGYAQRLPASLGAIPATINWKPGNALQAIPEPKLLISGQQDIITGGPLAVRAAEALGARHAIIEGVGHTPPVEAPDRLVGLLVELWKEEHA